MIDRVTFKKSLFPCLLPVILFIASAWWVPVNPNINGVNVAYYQSNLWDRLVPRALTGTIAQALSLSPAGYIYLLQGFRLAWIILLCQQLYTWVQNRRLVVFLAIMFTFNAPIYIFDGSSAFVDMVANFWLLAATSLLIDMQKRQDESKIILFAITLLLFLTVLTHEQFTVGCLVIIVWAALIKPWHGIIIAIPWLMMCGAYGYGILHISNGGLVTSDYFHLAKEALFYGHWDAVLRDFLSMYGVFSGPGMLWLIYGFVGWHALSQKHIKMVVFWIGGIAAALLPLIIAGDASRISGALWLPLFICIICQADWLSARFRETKIQSAALVALAIHLLIPPTLIYHQSAIPLNCYAARFLPLITTTEPGTVWTLQYNHDRPDITEGQSCWPIHFWKN